MSSSKRFVLLASLALLSLLPLGACANSPWARSLQRSLAADPRLQDNPVVLNPPNAEGGDAGTDAALLPTDFPAEIPRYPNAELINVVPVSNSDPMPTNDTATQTQWVTTDSADAVRQFYQTAFQADGWRFVSPTPGPSASAPAPTPASTSEAIVAERDNLRVSVAIASPTQRTPNTQQPTETGGGNTEFTIAYTLNTLSGTEQSTQAGLKPGDPDFIGPVPPAGWAGQTTGDAQTEIPLPRLAQPMSDLDEAPDELQPYLQDLNRLGVFGSDANEFKPNQVITRREFARWLVTANNLMYRDRPTQKIRLATRGAQPIFQDVPRTDDDFESIQGLAEAGLLPSPLSGDATTVTFRPDAELTREDLVLWKTPIDTRQSLPTANLEAVQQTWGFQDAARINPRALRAVLADYQNGDLSNIRRAFGYTTLFQPKKTVSRAEAAAVLWHFGAQGEGISAREALPAWQTGG